MKSSWKDVKRVDDQNELVAKFIFTKEDAIAEAVLYRYPTYAERTVICCSTQSGCPIGCRFCGAGNAFVRSLTVDEIVSQVEHLVAQTGVDPSIMGRLQVMFMSMGEPLLNYKNLKPAIEILSILYPNAALLISTSAPDVGEVTWNDLAALSDRVKTVGLQFSIHESTDEARDKLIPFKKKLDLKRIAEEGEFWRAMTGRKPFFNYCAHDENSSDEDADRIRGLFDPEKFCATVSVICEVNDGMPATNDRQRSLATDFASKLVERGFDVRVFDPAGQDTIGGGCGQLHQVQKWLRNNQDKAKPSIGNGLPVVHAPRNHSP